MHQYQVKQSKLRYSPLGAHTHCDSEQEWIVEYAKVLCQDLKNLHAFQWEVFRKKCRKGKIYFVQFLFLLKCSAVLRIPALILFNDCMYKIHCIHKFNKESDWKTLNKTKTTITEIKVIPKAKKQPDLPEKKKKTKIEHYREALHTYWLIERFFSESDISICKIRIRLPNSYWKTCRAEKWVVSLEVTNQVQLWGLNVLRSPLCRSSSQDSVPASLTPCKSIKKTAI